MENTNGQEFNKFSIPVYWGLIIGFISIFTFTIYSMFMMESAGIWGASALGIFSFLLMLILLGVMATKQRTAMGGYITFREAFQGIFVSILIITLMSQVYSIIYSTWIDPEYFEKMKEMQLNMTYKLGGSEEAMTKAEEKIEEQMNEKNSIKNILIGMSTSLILYSLFGFIVAAIVKRNKPEHLA